jgi:phage-related minor tail protein
VSFIVNKAKELGTVWIVSYDWLSDSLLMNNRRPLPAKNYLLEDSPAEETKVQKKGRQTKAQDNKVTKNRVVKRKAAETKAAKGKPRPSKALEEEALRTQFEKEKAEQERAQRGQEEAHQPVEDHSTRNALQITTAAEEKPKPIKKKRKRGPSKLFMSSHRCFPMFLVGY